MPLPPDLALVVEVSPQTGPVWWLPLIALLALLGGGIALLARRGGRRGTPPRRAATGLASATGLPTWAAAGIALALWSLTVALIGFTWDVAWHADLGRDRALFTPPHTMILVGLMGIGVAALAAVAVASAEGARVGLRAGRLRIPWSAIPMGLMALGAVVGFPLDDYWHATYGIDVTMWSPTHLLMIGGASLTPIAAWLMYAEADVRPERSRGARLVTEALATATLIGLSTFQLEFDLGIPQWQMLYHPVLIALAMGIGLVAARQALGPGGAVRATVGFLVLRALIALLVGPIFGLSVERFPLYLGGALAVEVVFLVGRRWSPTVRAIASGLGIATAGLAVEWGWTHAWGVQPWQPRLLASWWAVAGTAVTAALIGTLLGRAVAHERQAMTLPAAGLAFAAMAVFLAVPFPRTGDPGVIARIQAAPVGAATPVITRDGAVGLEQDMRVAVTLSPATAADGADVLRLTAWQGGRIINRTLTPGPGGTLVADGTVPTGGDWKSMVMLLKGDVVAAVPIEFPADPQYGLHPIGAPVSSPRTAPLQPASAYLMRESHSGSMLPAVLAYCALGVVAVAWCAALLGVGEAMRRRWRPALRRAGR